MVRIEDVFSVAIKYKYNIISHTSIHHATVPRVNIVLQTPPVAGEDRHLLFLNLQPLRRSNFAATRCPMQQVIVGSHVPEEILIVASG